jgi:thymidylate synthase (FAD)
MKCEFIDKMGDDLLVVNAARVSMDKEHSEFEGGDRKLLGYLAKHNHWTPFSHPRETFIFSPRHLVGEISVEQRTGMVWKVRDGMLKLRHSLWGWAKILHKFHPKLAECIAKELTLLYPECCKALGIYYVDSVDRDVQYRHIPNPDYASDNPCRSVCFEKDPDYIDVTMREKVPIFVARQRFKHMVGFTYNEVSRRYVDDEPEFYTPDVWRSRPEGSIKQGSGGDVVEELTWNCGETTAELPVEDAYADFLYEAEWLYKNMLSSGVAPEQARMVLPQSMMTSYYVTGSLSAWARAYKLRIDSHSQVEIQMLAKQWGDIIEPLFPESWAVLTGEE